MNITPIEKNGQRVLTTSQLAESFGTEAIKIQQNFNNNKDRYTEGKHFFLLQGDDLKSLKGNLENFEVASNINRLYLWTEKGTKIPDYTAYVLTFSEKEKQHDRHT